MKNLVYIFIFSVFFSFGQSLTHPHIWTSPSERNDVLNKINSDTALKWSGKLYNDLHNAVDNLVSTHKTSPQNHLSQLPDLNKNDNSRNDHSDALYIAVQAGILYFLDEDEDYAQFAADILSYYTPKIAEQTGDLYFSKTGHWIESRDLYPKVGMIYDFIQPFLKNGGNTVYDVHSGTRKSFDLDTAELAFRRLADEVFDHGGTGSNHSAYEASGALFNILCIENDSIRDVYFDTFMNGTPNQDGFHTILNTIKTNDYLWPESFTYGKVTHEVVLHLLNVVDRYRDSLNLVNSHRSALKGAFLYQNMKYPNKTAAIRMGDSRRVKKISCENLYLKVLAIAHRRSMNVYKNLAIQRIQALYNDEQAFEPTIENQGLEWDNPIQLFWGIDIDLENNSETVEYHSSAKFPHAGIGMLRNYNCENTEEFGLMGFIGGAHYVHSHLTGIEMELYGSGMVMGAGSGDPKASSARSSDVYRNYHRIYAGHNTVIINGDSKGTHPGSWKWDNILYQDKSEIIGIEPNINMDQTNSDGPFYPVSDNFSFVTVELDDNVNDALQQRTLSIIRTSETTGYYLDIFRSKSNGVNNFHDYIYHNYGEQLSLTSGGSTITNGIGSTDQTRYSSDLNTVWSYTTTSSAFIDFPGWQYFTNLNTTDQTTQSITGEFDVDKIGASMHFKTPSGVNRDYTACTAPPILETESDYKAEQSDPAKNDSAQVLVIRQYGEAWNRPFILAFEPSKSNSTIQSIEHLMTDSVIVGAKITSSVNGVKIIDFVINHDDNNQTYASNTEEIEFTGRFGIVRKYQSVDGQDSLIGLYIGEGSYIQSGNHILTPESEANSGYLQVDNIITSAENNSVLLEKLNFFPNPANTSITFNQKIKEVQIYTVQGKLVVHKNNITKLDISKLNGGNYIVIMNKSIHKELIISK